MKTPRRQGLVIVNTGDGKGNTLSRLASSSGREVVVCTSALSNSFAGLRAGANRPWRIPHLGHDKMTHAFRDDAPEVNPVIGWLQARKPQELHLIIIARDLSRAQIEYAVLVTAMREIKHPYRRGIKAQPGIDL